MLPAGRYKLTIPPRSRADNPLIDFDVSRGALKLLRPVTIIGDGARQTVVDGTGINRVLANWSVATITDVTVTGGFMPPISPAAAAADRWRRHRQHRRPPAAEGRRGRQPRRLRRRRLQLSLLLPEHHRQHRQRQLPGSRDPVSASTPGARSSIPRSPATPPCPEPIVPVRSRATAAGIDARGATPGAVRIRELDHCRQRRQQGRRRDQRQPGLPSHHSRHPIRAARLAAEHDRRRQRRPPQATPTAAAAASSSSVREGTISPAMGRVRSSGGTT